MSTKQNAAKVVAKKDAVKKQAKKPAPKKSTVKQSAAKSSAPKKSALNLAKSAAKSSANPVIKPATSVKITKPGAPATKSALAPITVVKAVPAPLPSAKAIQAEALKTGAFAPAKPSTPKEGKYQRRSVKHVWPAVGTILVGKLKGQVFKVEVIVEAKDQNEHGKALKSLTDPKLEPAYTFNDAAQRFTKQFRDKHSMKTIANPWKWLRRESDGKRLFDIPEYSKIGDSK